MGDARRRKPRIVGIEVKREYNITLGEVLDKYRENYQHQASFEDLKTYWLKNFRDHFGTETRLGNISKRC